MDDLRNLTFVVEGEEIKVNKTLMDASCPYFNTMLFGNTNESKLSTIELKSTPKVALKSIIEFVYKEQCDISSLEENELFDLISISPEYQFTQLIDHLFEKVKLQNFSVDFCVALFDLSVDTQMNEWREMCLEYFDDIFHNDVDAEIFTKLSKSLIMQLTARDSFLIDELDLFKCLIKWKEQNAQEDCGEIFANIRLHLIDIEDFVEFVMPTKVISSDDYLKSIASKSDSKRFAVFKSL
ncbi:BTB/POZ domain-containing protein 9-like protein [Leptotrombidium deliense]|uniref:BTB/POZ domain-containing protein 9-like protein n=1 Tax=Leptotrombidium deliense TaxID=299467 RepID=A0A443S082_9ACAR|nr:BTB/POZ domain-containing protein 9-like protein [Leptotrombidium deliense]